MNVLKQVMALCLQVDSLVVADGGKHIWVRSVPRDRVDARGVVRVELLYQLTGVPVPYAYLAVCS